MIEDRRGLTRYAWLSIAAALMTIVLKATAYLLTDSVGLLSDALESGVNLVAAIVALVVLTVAAQPPDDEHAYGHAKAEYFASGVEGTLIVFAALTIAISSVPRLIEPRPLHQLDLGLAVSVAAALLNLAVARVLKRAGSEYRSITLTADAQHLMTDVWTSVGVLVGLAAVALTGWSRLDALLALAVAVHILLTGGRLLRGSVHGLMDAALPAEEMDQISAILDRYCVNGVQYHALRTRQAGAQRFMSVHIQVPGAWSVELGHCLLEDLEKEVRTTLMPITVFTHLEPVEDPRSFEDIEILRHDG